MSDIVISTLAVSKIFTSSDTSLTLQENVSNIDGDIYIGDLTYPKQGLAFNGVKYYGSKTEFKLEGDYMVVRTDGDPYPAKAGASAGYLYSTPSNDIGTPRTWYDDPNDLLEQSNVYKFTYRGGTAAPTTDVSEALVSSGGINGIFNNGAAFLSPFGGSTLPDVNIMPENGYFLNAYYFINFLGKDLAGHPEEGGEYHYHIGTFLYKMWNNATFYNSIVYYKNTYYTLPSSTTYNNTYYSDEEDHTIDHMRHTNGHSKIVGFCFDGYPIYGPFGYSDATDEDGGVELMTSSYSIRSSYSDRPYPYNTPISLTNFINNISTLLGHSHSYYNVVNDANKGRIQMGAGAYTNDYEYVSGSGTLDYYNGRYTKTPDYPNGTYAYFITLDNTGVPQYPYIVGNSSIQQRTFTETSSVYCTISSDVNTITSGSATVTFTMNEATSDFSLADVTVSNGGSLTNFNTISSTVYTATYIPPSNTNTTVSITVLSETFIDADGNSNYASNTYQITTSPSILGQSLSSNSTVGDLLSQVSSTGSDLQAYAAVTGGTALSETDTLTQTTYYISQTLNSVESARTSVAVTLTTDAPSISSQSLSSSSTIANLLSNVSSTGSDLQAYAAANGGTALSETDTLTETTYYISQTVNGIESARTSVAVTLTTDAPSISSQTLVTSSTIANLLSQVSSTGSDLQAYAAANGGTALSETDTLTETTYYISQTVNGIESARTSVAVTLTDSVSSPSISSPVTLPSSSTVANLLSKVSTAGSNLKVYTAATGGSDLAGNVTLTQTTYYISQTVNSVESARTSVEVTLYNFTLSGDNTSITVTTAVSVNGVTYQWQHSSNGSTWSNIAGANSSSIDYTGYLDKYLRPIVTDGTKTLSDIAVIRVYTDSGSTRISIEMGNDVVSVVGGAFRICSNLTSVSMPSVTTIYPSIFQGCSNLTSVSMPLVTSIGQYAFQGCSGLTIVYMPLVTSIGNYAFLDCTNLKYVFFQQDYNASLFSVNPFNNINTNAVAYYLSTSSEWTGITPNGFNNVAQPYNLYTSGMSLTSGNVLLFDDTVGSIDGATVFVMGNATISNRITSGSVIAFVDSTISGFASISIPPSTSRSLTVYRGATVTISGNYSHGIIGSLSGSGNISISGSSIIMINNASDFTGTLQLKNGTTKLSTLSSTAAIVLASSSSAIVSFSGGNVANAITVTGSGTNTVLNTSDSTLTLSGTLTKNGTTLTLNGNINVTGTIVGTAANSDVVITGNVTYSDTIKSYNGATTIQSDASLTLYNSSIPNSDITVNGSLIVQNESMPSTVNMKSLTLPDGASLDLTDGYINTSIFTTSTGSSSITMYASTRVAIAGNMLLNGNVTLNLSGTVTTGSSYNLITYTGSKTGTGTLAFNYTGTTTNVYALGAWTTINGLGVYRVTIYSTIPVITTTFTNNITNNARPTISGTSQPSSTITIKDYSTITIGTTTANVSGAWSFTPTSNLTEGSHNITATATYSAITSAASTPLSFTVDTIAPTNPVITETTRQTISGTAEANSTIVATNARTNATRTVTTGADGKWSFSKPDTDGYKFQARDLATNISSGNAFGANFFFKYPRKSYTFSDNDTVHVLPHINGRYGNDKTTIFRISPDLPEGLTLGKFTGKISGTPTENSPATEYTIFSSSSVYKSSRSIITIRTTASI